VIDAATNAVVATVPVGNGPFGVAVNPAGTRVYVANLFEGPPGTVSVIDAATNAVVATVTVGDLPVAFGVFIAPSWLLPVPTLSEWGLILAALCLLTVGTWQLAGRPALVSRPMLLAVLAGQGVALLGAALHGVLIARVAPHDALGAWLCGGLLGALVACLRPGARRVAAPGATSPRGAMPPSARLREILAGPFVTPAGRSGLARARRRRGSA
jgi:YVTN family beta-propeller protein